MSIFRRILVAVDGSPASELALDEAVRLASTVFARLRLVHVIDDFVWANGVESANVYLDDVVPRMRRAGEQLLAQALQKPLAAGVEADSELIVGPAGRICEVIAEEATRWNADLVVTGTQGRRGVDRLLLGSDAEQIVRHAPVPVLLVRAASH